MSAPSQLSFLPEDYLERKAQRRSIVICALLSGVVMAAIGGAFYLQERMMVQAEADHIAVVQQCTDAARQIEQVQLMEQKQRKMARQADLASSLQEKIPRSIILAETINKLPTGVYLQEFSLTSQRRTPATPPPPPTAGKDASSLPADPIVYDVQLHITGVAPNDVQVAEYIHGLSHSVLFKDVNLIVSDELAVGEQKLRKFVVEMNLNNDADTTGLGAPPTARNTTAVLPGN